LNEKQYYADFRKQYVTKVYIRKEELRGFRSLREGMNEEKILGDKIKGIKIP